MIMKYLGLILLICSTSALAGINAGGDAFEVNGISYAADNNFLAGSTNRAIGTKTVLNDPAAPLLTTARRGESQYQIPVDNGVYQVEFVLAEIADAVSGQRVFDVALEGQVVLDNIDIAASVGQNTAYRLTADTTVTDGVLDLELISEQGTPIINAFSWTPVSLAATVDAGRDRVLNLSDSAASVSLTLEGSVIEPDGRDGSEQSLQWVLVTGDAAGLSIDDPAALTPQVTFSQPGLYTFQINVETQGLTITDQVNVLVSNRSISTADGQGADAMVRLGGGSSNSNFGAEPGLQLRNPFAGFIQKAYLRFDVSQLDQVATGIALGVSLTGIPGNSGIIGNDTFRVYGLNENTDFGYRRLDEFWQEGTGTTAAPVDADNQTISWIQAPGNDRFGGSTVNPRLTTFLGTFRSFQGRKRTEYFASPALLDFIQADANGVVTLIITRETRTNTASFFASRESATADSGFIAPTLFFAADADQNVAPQARFTADDTRIQQGQRIAFDAQASFDSDGTVQQYQWDFAEGLAPVTTTDTSISHTFTEAGIYPVGLTVVDNTGQASQTFRLQVTVDAVWDADIASVRFPVDAEVLDVTKAPFFAKGDGVSDDTQAIQAALDFYDAQSNAVIYLPDGEYRVTDTLFWPATINPDGTRGFGQQGQNELTIMQGQSRNAVIRLADDSAGFDQPAGKPIIDMGTSAAMNFRNSIRSLTIHTGNLNPGAVGVTYTSSNQGTAYDLLIIAGDGDGDGIDGDGVIGLDLTNNQNGPNLIKNVEIRGFDDGISNFDTQNSQTFENITLIDQKVRGFYNRRQAVFINGLTVRNRFGVPAIQNFRDGGSFITLINAEIENTGPSATGNAVGYIDFSNGFPNRTHVFLRNIRVKNYATAINVLSGFKDPYPANAQGVALIDEFVSDPTNADVVRLWPNLERSLNIPIQDAPEVPWGASDRWVNVLDFLTPEQRFTARDIDLAPAVQAALNSGATTIYFPRAGNNDNFFMEQDVIVPGTVRRVIGLETGLRGEGRFVLNDDGQPIIFERLFPVAGGIQHNSARTVIVKNGAVTYRSAGGAGDFFGEDILGSTEFNQQNAWLRQYNSECVSPRMRNNGGQVWVLGVKTECFGPVIETYQGGTTEVLGTFFYTSGTPGFAADQPFGDRSLAAFVTVDSNLSVAGHREQNFVGTQYDTIISETRNGTTRTRAGSDNDGVVASSFMLYTAYAVDAADNQPPVVAAGRDINLIDQTTVSLAGSANDDGFPNRATTFFTQWSQLSGPADVLFADTADPQTTATFPLPGVYELRLRASEGGANAATTTDTVRVLVADEQITTATGNGADATVSGNSSGSSTSFAVSRSNFSQKAYLRLDVSELNLDNLEAAALSLEQTGNSVFVRDFTLNVFGLIEADYGDNVLDEQWDEASINSANAPGNGPSNGGPFDPQVTDSAGVLSEFTTYLGQVQTRQRINDTLVLNTPALVDFLKSDTNGVVTLIITREEFSGNSGLVARFTSKEGSGAAPTLQVVYANNDADTDGDGLTDQYELDNGLNPDSPDDAALDSDGDGLTNLQEFNLQTDPQALDSDGDGVDDGFEVASGTDPWNLLSTAELQRDTVVVDDTFDDPERWTAVRFEQAFAAPPVVIMGVPSANGVHQLTVLVRNVTTEGFEFKLDEWDYLDQQHTSETVSWMALPQGQYTIKGRAVTAGTYDRANHVASRVEFERTFSTLPMVLAQRITVNEATTTATRIQIDTSGFEVRLDEQELFRRQGISDHLDETIAYVAIEPGNASDNSFIVGLTEPVYTNDFQALPVKGAQLFAGIQTLTGWDPTAIRYRLNSQNAFEVMLEEEQSFDEELIHVAEQMGFWVFD